MNAGRDVERLIADWFVEEAVLRAPDRVLEEAGRVVDRTMQRRPAVAWRTLFMTRFAFAGAAVALATIVAVAGLTLNRAGPGPEVGGPSPSLSPSQPPAEQSLSPFVSTLTDTFTSSIYDYSIRTDPTWTVTRATVDADDPAATDENASDRLAITGTDTTIAVMANDLGGQSFDAWLADIHEGVLGDFGVPGSCKNGEPGSWPAQPVGSETGVLMTLCNFAQVFVEVDGQAYTFTWSHDTFDVPSHLDFLDFKRALETVTFGVGAAASPTFAVEQLTGQFTSPLYGYTIPVGSRWTVTPATTARTDPLSEETFSDEIQLVPTDSGVSGSAAPLGDRAWDELLSQLQELAIQTMPSGCGQSDPSTWPTVDVGGHDGRLQQACNAAWVYVLVDDRVYEFDWGNSSFDTESHFSEGDFIELLKGVTFPSAGPGASAPSTP